MPIVFNKDSGLAEQLDQNAALKALHSDTHELGLYDPDGSFGTASFQDSQALLAKGYRKPTPEELNHHLEIAQHSTGLDKVKTFAEGMANAATLGGASAAESALLGNAKDQRLRREALPGWNTTGQVAGLVTSAAALPGGGVAGLMTKAGEGAAEAVGLGAAETLLPRVTASAVKQATEMAIFQSGDEVAKAFQGDPEASLENALPAIGLSALIGGGFGGATTAVGYPLWKAVKGSKLTNTLSLLKDKVYGGAGEDAAIGALEQKAGVKLSPEIRSALQNNPTLQTYASDLMSSGTSTGDAIRMTMEKAKQDLNEGVVKAAGRTMEDVSSINNLSPYESGTVIKDKLVSNIEREYAPIAESFDRVKAELGDINLPRTSSELPKAEKLVAGLEKKVQDLTAQQAEASKGLKEADDLRAMGGQPKPHAQNKYESTTAKLEKAQADLKEAQASHQELRLGSVSDESLNAPVNTQQEIAEKIAELATRENYSAPQRALVEDVLRQLPHVDNLDALSKVYTRVGEQWNTPGIGIAPRQIKELLFDAQTKALEETLAGKAPELIAEHQAARAEYKQLKMTIEDLNDKLHLGKVRGPGGFIQAIKDADPEKLLARMSTLKSADFSGLLESKFPDLVKDVKGYQIDKMIKDSTQKGGFNASSFYERIRKLNPEARDFLFTQEQQLQMESSKQLLDMLPKNGNPSGSATTWDRMQKGAMGGLFGTLFAMTGHNPIAGMLLGGLSRYATREMPDALKLATLKFLGSEGPVEAGAFKSMFHAAEAAYKGAAKLESTVSSVFKEGEKELTNHLLPSPKSLVKLDEYLKAANVNPMDTIQDKDDLHYYAPEHAQARTQLAARALNYLHQVKPDESKLSPFEPERPLNKIEQVQYNRTLAIAEQPLVVFAHLKDGTLTTRDIQDVSSMYPSAYSAMQQKLLAKMIEHTSGGGKVPYGMRLNIGVFLGQPLDSSTKPVNMSINALVRQSMGQGAPTQSKPSQGPLNASKGHSLLKVASADLTPSQRRGSARLPK